LQKKIFARVSKIINTQLSVQVFIGTVQRNIGTTDRKLIPVFVALLNI